MPKGLLQINGRHLTVLRISQRSIKRASKKTLTSLEGQLTSNEYMLLIHGVMPWFSKAAKTAQIQKVRVTSLRGHNYKMLMTLTVAMTYYWCKEFSPE